MWERRLKPGFCQGIGTTQKQIPTNDNKAVILYSYFLYKIKNNFFINCSILERESGVWSSRMVVVLEIGGRTELTSLSQISKWGPHWTYHCISFLINYTLIAILIQQRFLFPPQFCFFPCKTFSLVLLFSQGILFFFYFSTI